MPAAAVKTSENPGVVGKKELAAAIGWSRPTLDRRLNADAGFPVLSRGGRGGGWEFDLNQVVAYLRGEPADLVEQAEAATAPVQLSVVRQQHQGEKTARQLRDQADADLKIDRLKRSRGELVEAAVMRQVLETVLVEMRSALLGMPDALGKEFDLSERVVYAMKGKVEGTMRSTVQSLRQQLDTDL